MAILTTSEFFSRKPSITEYNERDINKEIELSKEVSEFYPASAMVQTTMEDGKEYFHHTFTRLNHPTLSIVIRKDDYKHKYMLWCNDIQSLPNTEHYSIQREKEGLTEPVTMGKLSTKKILAWVNYYEELYNRVKIASDEKGNEKHEFIKSLAGQTVRWYNNNKQGEIIKGGLKFSFTIGDTYISKKIETYYETENDLATFLKLADNKYLRKPKTATV